MLVKTESVDMTWGGIDNKMSEERESWCKETDVNEFSIKKNKSHVFFFAKVSF